MKSIIRKYLRRFGVDIRHVGPGWSPDLTDFLVNRQVNVVLDVGANVGQFGQALRKRGYHGEIVSVEPIEEVFHRLNELVKRDRNWQVHRT